MPLNPDWLLMASRTPVQLIGFVLVFSLTFIVMLSLSRPAVTSERGYTSSTLAEKFMPSVSASQASLSKVPTLICAMDGILLLSARFHLAAICVSSIIKILLTCSLKVSTRALRPSTSLPECARFEWALSRAGGWSIEDKQSLPHHVGLRFIWMAHFSGWTRCCHKWRLQNSDQALNLDELYYCSACICMSVWVLCI